MNGTWLFDLSHACHHWHGTTNIHCTSRDHSSLLSALRIISLARKGCGVRVIEWVMEGRRGRGVEGLCDVDGLQDAELPLKGVNYPNLNHTPIITTSSPPPGTLRMVISHQRQSACAIASHGQTSLDDRDGKLLLPDDVFESVVKVSGFCDFVSLYAVA